MYTLEISNAACFVINSGKRDVLDNFLEKTD
jgi:hypothetical protein